LPPHTCRARVMLLSADERGRGPQGTRKKSWLGNFFD
jgi:hypothetical protein